MFILATILLNKILIFVYTGNDTLKQDIEDTKIHDFVFINFSADVYESVVRGSNAHLLSELLKDWLSLCLEKKIESKINHTHHIKTKMTETFTESIGFYKTGRQVIVFSQLVNPCEYSVNILKGVGLRELELTKSIANMINRKADEKTVNGNPHFPYSPDDLKTEVKKGPLCELYNAIYLSINDTIKLDDEGCAFTTSKNLTCQIWSLAKQWEALLFKPPTYRNPMQILMEMTLYRLTQSKEIIQYLQMNACISYNDIY